MTRGLLVSGPPVSLRFVRLAVPENEGYDFVQLVSKSWTSHDERVVFDVQVDTLINSQVISRVTDPRKEDPRLEKLVK